ncbi:PREDICTED: nidogen-1 [Papilio xuthus]|uniref:Nidogen-1 n=1 Tax=Papilio xuthus TaxID=66420 RepID=A0AAJ6ZUR2_PAPXU|nr:PREDICTED: nidogen-1 [Papilio xuthus]
MWTCAGVLALVACACAVTRDQFYPYGPTLDASLPKGQAASSPEIPLKVPISFYGETYETIFVNNYGVLSFRADIPSFLNAEFPLPYPSIAAFYTNVDTSEVGDIFYRETDEPHVLIKAEESVQSNFHDYYDFKPKSVFIATWLEVSYAGHSDRKNSFQIAVISNGTESFVELIYPERDIQWIQREAQPNSLPDAKAQAGFVAEDGRLLTLRGSGSHQIRNVVSWSNVHEPGKYVFRVGNISSDGNVAVPDLYNQNEDEIEEESKTCAQSGPSVCHIQARCVDYPAGICCQCEEGFYGNGKSCIKDDVPLRVHGKVNGIINNVNLNDVDVQAYVVVADGRSYTALSQAPPTLGTSLLQLSVIGGVIGWLFAKPSGDAKNGYQLTGALFNHSADIFFPDTGDRLTVYQEYLGHDVFDQITLEADVRGTIPVVAPGTKLDISEYEEQYTLVELGVLRSDSSRTFTNKVTGEKYEQRVSQTFTFNSCRYHPPSEDDTTSSTLKVAKNYLGYESRENIVRYGTSNKIVALGKEDPCIEGKNSCGPHSTCVVQGDTFACVCQSGFSSQYRDDSTVECDDIDECTTGTHNCDTNADCYNHEGGFQCRCRDGYEGNGVSCSRVLQCRDRNCDPNAQCLDTENEAICMCNPGFTGDGQRCWPTYENKCSPNCSPNAYCRFVTETNNYNCECNSGYIGDGYYCTPDVPTTPTTERASGSSYPTPPTSNIPYNYPSQESSASTYASSTTSYQTAPSLPPYRPTVPDYPSYPNAFFTPKPSTTPSEEETLDESEESEVTDAPTTKPTTTVTESDYNESIVLPHCDVYECTCPAGYISFKDERGNSLCRYDPGIKCLGDSDCPPNAICSVPSPEATETNYGQCICPEGYEGDAYECIEKRGPTCSCGMNAHCIDTPTGELICVCATGYHGDGYLCRPNFSCTNNSDCEYHAECRPDPGSGDYACQCIDGYIKDQNDACIPDGQLCNGAVCAEHASCLYDETIGVSYCHCDPGYEGEGIGQCVPQGNTCDVAHDCSYDAACTLVDQSYQCVCKDGFTGDGYTCTPELSCRINPYMCDIHAACIKSTEGYECACNTGYNGNGTVCELNPRQAGNFLVASDGASVFRVPFRVSPRVFATPLHSAVYQMAVGIDVDCLTGRIYWGDVAGHVIKTAAYDGSSLENFLTEDIKTPEGLSVDWAARNIFWTDSKKLSIEVANLDRKTRKVLFSVDGIANPRGIAVHPQRGKIFWSDWNRNGPKIEWANMDGTQRGVFLDQTDVKLPNSLAIDWARDRLCYADAGLFSIRCVSIATSERETIAANCSHPFGLAISGDKFYWTDWRTLDIEYIDTVTQVKGRLPIAAATRRLYGVAVAPEDCPTHTNVCQYRNGNCGPEQLCLPDGRGGRTCVDGDANTN